MSTATLEADAMPDVAEQLASVEQMIHLLAGARARLIGRPDLADDFAAELKGRMYELLAAGRYNPKYALTTYVGAVARTVLRDAVLEYAWLVRPPYNASRGLRRPAIVPVGTGEGEHDPEAPGSDGSDPGGPRLDQLAESVRDAIEKLPPRQAEVIRLVYGIGGVGPCTHADVGRAMGLTRARIWQIVQEAQQRLGRIMRSEGGMEVL